MADSTSWANEADDGGGIFSGDGASIAVTNSILWMNLDASGTTAQAQIKGPGSKTLEYSCVQNLFASGGFPTCIEADPRFVDADGPDNAAGTADDNLRLLADSPCIDAGSNAAIPAGTTVDRDGGPRRRDDPATPDTGSGTAPIVDMGAYEYGGASAITTVSINSGADFVGSTQVNLSSSVISGAGVTRMSFSNDGATWSVWEPFGPNKVWILAPGDGLRTVYGRFGDGAGGVLAEAFDSIGLDTTPPTGTITIDGGAASTPLTSVTLSLTASDSDAGSGVEGMRFSDDGASWTPWAPLSATRSWNLPGGDGLKIVYAQFRDFLGNISQSFSDTIVLQVGSPDDFIRGDAYWDPAQPSGVLDILDAFAIRSYLENLPGQWVGNFDAADVNDDGAITYEDQEMLERHLSGVGSVPPAPFPTAGADPTADGISRTAVAPKVYGTVDGLSRLSLAQVAASAGELRVRVSLDRSLGGEPATAAHGAVRFDPIALTAIDVSPLQVGNWSVIAVNFDDGIAPVGEIGFTIFCDACPQDPPSIPDGDLVEITFSVQGVSSWTRPVELVEHVGRENLYFYTGLGRRIPAGTAGTPTFVPCLRETTSSVAFVRGDANDDGAVDITDAVKILLHLFAGAQIDCRDALDADDSGALNITDAIFTLTFLFLGGLPPPEPFPACGTDMTEDSMRCDRFVTCP